MLLRALRTDRDITFPLAILTCVMGSLLASLLIVGLAMIGWADDCRDTGGSPSVEGGTMWCHY